MNFLSKINKHYVIASYEEGEIKKAIESLKGSEYAATLQVRGQDVATKWLSVPVEVLEDLIVSIKKHKK